MISVFKDPRIGSPGLQLGIYNLNIVSWSFPGRILKCRWSSLYVVLKIWPRTTSISFLKISIPLKLQCLIAAKSIKNITYCRTCRWSHLLWHHFASFLKFQQLKRIRKYDNCYSTFPKDKHMDENWLFGSQELRSHRCKLFVRDQHYFNKK